MRDPAAALNRVVDVLEGLFIPYQVTGGLAARAYGSERELADIDIDVPSDSLERLYEALKEWAQPPQRFTDEHWDLQLLRARINGQDVELCGADSTLLRTGEEWVHYPIDLSRYELLEVLGRRVRVIPKKDLIVYKRILSRPVDTEDIASLTRPRARRRASPTRRAPRSTR